MEQWIDIEKLKTRLQSVLNEGHRKVLEISREDFYARGNEKVGVLKRAWDSLQKAQITTISIVADKLIVKYFAGVIYSDDCERWRSASLYDNIEISQVIAALPDNDFLVKFAELVCQGRLRVYDLICSKFGSPVSLAGYSGKHAFIDVFPYDIYPPHEDPRYISPDLCEEL